MNQAENPITTPAPSAQATGATPPALRVGLLDLEGPMNQFDIAARLLRHLSQSTFDLQPEEIYALSEMVDNARKEIEAKWDTAMETAREELVAARAEIRELKQQCAARMAGDAEGLAAMRAVLRAAAKAVNVALDEVGAEPG